MISLVVFVCLWWFVIHPNSYEYKTAVKNGDVVMGPEGTVNADELFKFIESIEQKRKGNIRITTYSKEGYPTIFDLESDGSIIICRTDNTRNVFGREMVKQTGTYTKIITDANNNYFLFDENKIYEKLWIFQD